MYHDTSFRRSAEIQIRVLGALVLRETLTRYGRKNLGFLWLFVEPMLFTLGVTALWTTLKSTHGSNLPVAAFAVTGYSSVLLWRNCANRCALAILPNQNLLYHRNIKILDFFWARLILEISGATISFIVLTFTFVLFGMMRPPDDLSVALMGWGLLVLFSSALGLFVGAMTERSDVAERFWHPISYFLFPISGAVYMVDWLPTNLQSYALYVPLVSGVELLREGYFGTSVRAHYDISYLVSSSLVLMFIALLLIKEAANRVALE